MGAIGYIARLQGADQAAPIELAVAPQTGTSTALVTVPGETAAHAGTELIHTVLGVTANALNGTGGVAVVLPWSATPATAKNSNSPVSSYFNNHYTTAEAITRLASAGTVQADFTLQPTQSGSPYTLAQWIAMTVAIKPASEGGTVTWGSAGNATNSSASGSLTISAPSVGTSIWTAWVFVEGVGNVVTPPSDGWTQYRHATFGTVGEIYAFWRPRDPAEPTTYSATFAFGPPAATPPTDTAAAVISWVTGSDPQPAGTSIHIAPGTAGNSPSTQTLRIQRSTDGSTGWSDITVIGPSPYPITAFDYVTQTGNAGDFVSVLQTATNSGGSSPGVRSNVLHIKAAGPSVNQRPSMTGPVNGVAYPTVTLTRVAGAYQNAASVTSHWQIDGVDIGGVALNATSYTPVSGDVGHHLRIHDVVVGTNGDTITSDSDLVAIQAFPTLILELWLTDGGIPGNTDQNHSLGGNRGGRGSVSNGVPGEQTLDPAFDTVLGSQSLAGMTDYRWFVVLNPHLFQPGQALVFIDTDSTSPDSSVQVAWGLGGNGVPPAILPTDVTAPVDANTFTAPTTTSPADGGILGPGEWRALCVKWTYAAGSRPMPVTNATPPFDQPDTVRIGLRVVPQ